jgi:glycosyltransferase involved in cell wall biosynthesis
VVHGETGFLVHTAAEMVQFIPRIDQIDREALRIYVEQHYSAQVMAENYVKIYEKLIKTNGDRAATWGRIPIGEAAT